VRPVIDDREGRRKYELQKAMLDAQRTRDTDLARAETAFAGRPAPSREPGPGTGPCDARPATGRQDV